MKKIINKALKYVPLVSHRVKLWVNTARLKTMLAQAEVGEDVSIRPPATIVAPDKLRLGRCVVIERGFYAFCHGGLEIGDFTGLSTNCSILTRDHDFNNPDALPYGSRYVLKKVTIGRCVFVGMNVTILPGVTIGDGAIVGAGSVVAKDIPALAVAVGNPARVVKYRNREVFERLLESENKRIQYIRGPVMPEKQRRALVEKYGKLCRDHLQKNDIFTLSDDIWKLGEKKKAQVLYYIAVGDPELEFIEHGDSYAVRKRST